MSDQESSPTIKRIGVAIDMGSPLAHHHGCYRGIVEYLRAHRPEWQTVIDPHMIGLRDASFSPPYDGVIGRITEETADQAQAAGIPVVNHWSNSPATGVPSVLADCHADGRIVAEHFVEQGYKRLQLISSTTDRVKRDYLEGLQSVARSHDIEVLDLDIPYDFEEDPKLLATAYQKLREALKRIDKPIGVYVPLDSMALYVVQICNELGIRVPDEVGLAVAYNSLDVCLNTRPTLSSIEGNNPKIGYEAMRVLDQIMHGESAPSEPIFVPPKTLRVRGSSRIFVCEDATITKAMRFIAENARNPICVDEVADAAGVSKRTLSRRFDAHVGKSILTEINRVRTQTIKQELVDTEQPISEVAAACGFTSTSHFNVFFRKATDMTPGEYRRKHRLQS
jgi:LacI family transcriptional regulator